MGKSISVRYDFAFKYLFLNEVVRRHFISDALGIPLEEIREVRLANTFLWKRYWRQKQGILEYDKLKRCICISILGFNMDERPEYHKVYRLRDETGYEFSDMLEVHVVELNKSLSGNHRMDDWIRLFNAKTEEEMEMLKASTKNLGVLEAIKEVRVMSLRKNLRLIHEARLKEIRDRDAREDYVRREGWNEGRNEGEDRLNGLICRLIADERFEDLKKATQDKEYREQLYKEYGIL